MLGDTLARASDIKLAKSSSFCRDSLVRLAARGGLNPRLKLAAQAFSGIDLLPVVCRPMAGPDGEFDSRTIMRSSPWCSIEPRSSDRAPESLRAFVSP